MDFPVPDSEAEQVLEPVLAAGQDPELELALEREGTASVKGAAVIPPVVL